MIKTITLLLWGPLFLFLFLHPVTAQTGTGKTGYFRWAFVGMDGQSEPVPLGTDQVIPGELSEQVQIYFRPMKNAYLYLIMVGPGETPVLLFPLTYDRFNSYYETFIQEISPLKLAEGKGQYELQVLIAASRLPDLEQLFAAYRQVEAGKGPRDQEKEGALKTEILALIQKIKRTYYFNTEKQTLFSDKAAPTRTEETALERYIQKIEFKDYYVEEYIFEK